MDIKKLQTLVLDALEDVKAQDVKVYDTTHLTSLFDRICIASGTSNRQTKALAASVREKVKEHGGDVIGVDYRLEELWGDKEVKIGAAKRVSKRTAEEPVEEKAPRVRSNINQATQTTLDDEVKKPARKPRVAAVAGEEVKPKRAPRTAAATGEKKPAAPRKKAIGTTVKVAASKTAVSSAKQAAAKKATRKSFAK